jgi:general secretion pathway protein F
MSWSSAAAFYHQLGIMLKAGLTIPQAIENAGRAATGFHARHAPAWAAACAGGRALAEPLAASGEEPVARALVLAGEQSGHLPEMVQEIAQINEHRMALRQLVIARLIYPLLLINVALVMPGFVSWFTTGSIMRLVLAPLLFWGLVGGLAITVSVLRGSGVGARLALLPLVRTLTDPLIAANTCLVLRAAATAGMLHHRGMELAADGCGNSAMGARLHAAADGLMRGRLPNFTAACRECGLPRTVLQLIEAGEVSGALEENLGRAAALARESFRERTMWAARIFTGMVYAMALMLAAYTVVTMYAGAVSAPMKMLEES